ncbi:transposable element Tcb1 transposase [Trichonephila clavipes]|nr:transposable element Tcb1 transposase [Trichonephila clavipes]
MSRRKQRSAFDQASEFDRGRIVAYRERLWIIFQGNRESCWTKPNNFTHLSETPRWSVSNLETPWREDAEQLRYAPPHWSCTGYYGTWGGIGNHSRTPLIRIAGTLNSQRYISEVLEPIVLPYLQGLAIAIFQQDNARPHVARIVQRFFVNHQIELLPCLARSPDLSPIENMWSMVAERLTQITPPAATPDQLWQRVEAAWSAVPQEHIQSLFESMPRRMAVMISNNGGYSGY